MTVGLADGSIRWIVHDTATVHAAVIDPRSVRPSSPSTTNSNGAGVPAQAKNHSSTNSHPDATGDTAAHRLLVNDRG
jgi:hypothetical protein